MATKKLIVKDISIGFISRTGKDFISLTASNSMPLEMRSVPNPSLKRLR